MIVRIFGEGQWEVGEEHLRELNVLDSWLEQAVEADDETGFEHALTALLHSVRETGSPLPADRIVPSDLVLPGPGTTLEQVRAMLSDEGLIPG